MSIKQKTQPINNSNNKFKSGSQDDYQKQSEKKLLNIVLDYPFTKKIVVGDLPAGQMFKFMFFLENGEQTINQTVYGSTKCNMEEFNVDKVYQDLPYYNQNNKIAKGFCDSENILYKLTVESNMHSRFFTGEKEIKKHVLQARKTKNTNEFINTAYKFAKPPQNKQERFKRTLLVSRGLEAFEDVYGFRNEQNTEQNQQFLKNDWFMGPFYSYDMNARQMKSNLNKSNNNNNNN